MTVIVAAWPSRFTTERLYGETHPVAALMFVDSRGPVPIQTTFDVFSNKEPEAVGFQPRHYVWLI